MTGVMQQSMTTQQRYGDWRVSAWFCFVARHVRHLQHLEVNAALHGSRQRAEYLGLMNAPATGVQSKLSSISKVQSWTGRQGVERTQGSRVAESNTTDSAGTRTLVCTQHGNSHCFGVAPRLPEPLRDSLGTSQYHDGPPKAEGI